MKKIFRFRKIPSETFGVIYRPYAEVTLFSKDQKRTAKVRMIVDSGADFTILPRFLATELGISLYKDCQKQTNFGLGGEETIYLFRGLRAKLGKSERVIPVGFLTHSNVPPLLGRHKFMETFKTIFHKHKTIFEEDKS